MTSVTSELQARPNIRFRQVGRPLTRTDAPGKVTGRTPYAGDYVMPGMLHMRVVRADIASARLVRLDVSKARALEGVACVLTAADLPDRTASTDIPGQTGRKRLDTGQQILVRERVRYFGEPLALIAAETRDIADHAMELVEADLEPIPGVYDPLEAMKPGAPVVTEPDNIVAERRIRKGDVEAGFAAAAIVVENTFRTPFQEHAFLEPEVGLTWVDENEVINIRMSTQVIEHFRFIAEAHRSSPQQGAHTRLPHRRRLRRQGGHHRRNLPGAAGEGARGDRYDSGVLPGGFLLRPRQASSVCDPDLSNRVHRRKARSPRMQVDDDGGRRRLRVLESPTCSSTRLVAAPGPYRVDNLQRGSPGPSLPTTCITSAFRGFGAAPGLHRPRAADG